MRTLWVACGLVMLALGAIGLLLPTVPFLLLAAFCFARSSQHLHDWLLTHRTFGPPIADWHLRGAIRRPTKWLATASICAAVVPPLVLQAPWWLIGGQVLALLGVAIFIWTRPEA
jgi:uncharacterized membrane protein YbaN (DUF454 family)